MHYLVGGTGIPNYGDELIAKGWLSYLHKAKPNSRVYLDCAIPSVSTSLLQPENWRASHVSFVKDAAAKGVDLSFWENVERGYKFFKRGGFSTLQRLRFVNETFAEAETFHLIGGGYISDKWAHTGFLLGFAASLKREFGTRLLATGLGLIPIAAPPEKYRRMLYRIVNSFDVFEVRDRDSAEFLVEHTGLKRKISYGLDDCFLTPVSNKRTDSPTLHISCFLDESKSQSLAESLRGEMKEIRNRFSKIVFWRCAPHRDQVAYEKLKKAIPQMDVLDVPQLISKQIFQYGDFMISNRFHPHMMAARAGGAGYFYQISGDYYAAKHKSVIDLGSSFLSFEKFSESKFMGGDSLEMAKSDVDRMAAKRKTADLFYEV